MRVEKLASEYASQISELYKEELDQIYLLGTVYRNQKINNYLKHICDENIEAFFGIVEEGRLLAVVQYREIAASLHINNIVVSSLHQGRGLGKVLLDWVFQLASSSDLNVSLDVDSINTRAFNWYLSLGFVTNSEIKSTVFKMNSKAPSKVTIYDDEKLLNFGFSDVSLEDIDDLEFFFIAPDTFRFKNTIVVQPELLNKLDYAINGLLVVNSSLLSNTSKFVPFYEKLVFRMVKNVI